MVDFDFLIQQALEDAETESGVSADYLASKGHRALISRRGAAERQKKTGLNQRNTGWRRHEIKFVRDHLGKLGYAEIAERVGRSAQAVKLLQVRRQIPAPSKQTGYLTGQGMAKLMGCDIHSVMLYAKRGMLPFERVPGKRGILRIKKVRVYMWAVNPENWPFFKFENIQDKKLKRLVELARERWDDEWLTPGEAERILGWKMKRMNCLVNSGKISGKRWGNWYFKRSEVERLRKFNNSLVYTHRADDYIRRMLKEGMPVEEIAARMKMTRHSVGCRIGRWLSDE